VILLLVNLLVPVLLVRVIEHSRHQPAQQAVFLHCLRRMAVDACGCLLRHGVWARRLRLATGARAVCVTKIALPLDVLRLGRHCA